MWCYNVKRYRVSLFIIMLSWMMYISLHAQNNVSVGGYGELHYNKPTSGVDRAASAGKLDFHRFVMFFGYHFNDWVSFNSEFEVEHTFIEGGEDTGELSIEQAYVNLQYTRAFGLRAGIMLVPLGIVNPYHEPPSFHGVERPNVEKYIIPSTWREAGVGFTGSFRNGVKYETYLMAGLDASDITGKNGIRGARQKAFESSTQDYSIAARLDYTVNLNLRVGAAGFLSTLEKSADFGSALEGAKITMGELHAQYTRNNLEARGLVVLSSISDADKLNSFFSPMGPSPLIGDQQFGAYGEVAYDFMGFFIPQSEQRLFAFIRYEVYNTQQEVTGFEANPNYERKETTIGFTYKPTALVTLKADYQFLNTSGPRDVEQFNLGMGYNF